MLSVKGSRVVPSSKPTLICFELADDLELILEGRPWFFRNSVILFDRLCQAVDRDQIRLTSSPYWMKIDSISPEFDKKDLMHAIGATFGGVLRSEINEDSCRLIEYGELLGGREMNGEEEGLMRLKKDEESKVCPRKQDHIKYEDKAN
ncbi:hypothetical protein Goshw_017916 [Gossypium schwendimanii]|uniref:DUF4283 domain-containing protein n=1 Tax=Gossypium schwendimanii TaxID=34291 RepID=A0A7J9MJ13_GOSSC|nr:hypothetical protein [Gossypium schwendimanii]